jgi:hypothetical protein
MIRKTNICHVLRPCKKGLGASPSRCTWVPVLIEGMRVEGLIFDRCIGIVEKRNEKKWKKKKSQNEFNASFDL